MALYKVDGSLLKDGNSLAKHEDCCCEEEEDCPGQGDPCFCCCREIASVTLIYSNLLNGTCTTDGENPGCETANDIEIVIINDGTGISWDSGPQDCSGTEIAPNDAGNCVGFSSFIDLVWAVWCETVDDVTTTYLDVIIEWTGQNTSTFRTSFEGDGPIPCKQELDSGDMPAVLVGDDAVCDLTDVHVSASITYVEE